MCLNSSILLQPASSCLTSCPPCSAPPTTTPIAGYNESLGARELRRAVTRLVDDALSDALLRGEVRGWGGVLLGYRSWAGQGGGQVWAGGQHLAACRPCHPASTCTEAYLALSTCTACLTALACVPLPSNPPSSAGAPRRGCGAGLRRPGPHPGVQPLPRQQHCGRRHCLLLGGRLSSRHGWPAAGLASSRPTSTCLLPGRLLPASSNPPWPLPPHPRTRLPLGTRGRRGGAMRCECRKT